MKPYNLIIIYMREMFKGKYLKLAEEINLSVVPYWSLASGFLTGKYRSEDDLNKSVRGNDVKKYLNDKGYSILKALDEVAEKHQTCQASVALDWLMNQLTIAAPISSATKLSQLDTLIHAAELKLSQEDIDLLTQMGK